MNYFFKFLVPQLLEYFNNNNEAIEKFIPKIILEKYSNDKNGAKTSDISNKWINAIKTSKFWKIAYSLFL